MSLRKGAMEKVRQQLTKAGVVEVTESIKLARPVTAQNSASS